jgi:quinoprotein glucose dehydrogenase
LRSALVADACDNSRLPALADLIVALHSQTSVQALVGKLALDSAASSERRAWVVSLMGRCYLEEIPDSWVQGLSIALRDPGAAVRLQAVKTAIALHVKRLDPLLESLANSATEPLEMRLEALHAILPWAGEPSTATFDFLIGLLSNRENALVRLGALECLTLTKLDDARRIRLLDAVENDALITPEQVRRAFAPPVAEATARRWIDYLDRSLHSGWHPQTESLNEMLATIPSLPQSRREALLRLLSDGENSRQARLATFQPLMSGGDPDRGRAVFFGTKAACSNCHRAGGEGGRVGPDLTSIGAVRSGQDLLESIVFPSSTFAQGFETYTIATTDGLVRTGVLARQDKNMVVIHDGSGAEAALRRGEIEEMKRAGASLMPEGLVRVLSGDELRDLLAFLRSRR